MAVISINQAGTGGSNTSQNVNNNGATTNPGTIQNPAAGILQAGAPATTGGNGQNAPISSVLGNSGQSQVGNIITAGAQNTALNQNPIQAQGISNGFFQPLNAGNMPQNMTYGGQPNLQQSYSVNGINSLANMYPNVNLQGNNGQQLLSSPLSQPSNEQMALQNGKLGLQNFMRQNQYNNGNNGQMQVPMQQNLPVQPLVNSNVSQPQSMYAGINNQNGQMAGGVTSGAPITAALQAPLGAWAAGISPSTQGYVNPASVIQNGYTDTSQNIDNNNAPIQTLAPISNPASGIVSDENLKTDIKPAEKNIEDFITKIGAHSYTYKDPKYNSPSHPKGQEYTSLMAQELEQTKLGKQAVINTPEGKMVDYQRLGALNLAIGKVLHTETEKHNKEITVLHQETEKLKRQIAQMKRGK